VVNPTRHYSQLWQSLCILPKLASTNIPTCGSFLYARTTVLFRLSPPARSKLRHQKTEKFESVKKDSYHFIVMRLPSIQQSRDRQHTVVSL
jgi:hypothetical protein